MIIFVFFIFTFIVCIGTYIYGYKQGYIDGKLDERWRVRDERKNNEHKRNSRDC